MQFAMYSQEFELTEAIRRHTGARMLAALEHQEHRVQRVDVRLRDLNGPRGGEDKLCEIVVALRHHGRVVVSDTGSDLYSAINRAAHRVKELLARRLRRIQERQHRWQGRYGW